MKNIITRTYKPAVERYLARTRIYRYGDIRLEIPPEVFHPGFFFSTRFLLRHLLSRPLTGKRLLELGCGSGLISLAAAQQGARVTATDINPVAVEYLLQNSRANGIELEVLQSDLMTSIPKQVFDLIAINPPYYKKAPQTMKDHAWYCGEQGEYFSSLFSQLADHIHPGSEIWMVLCDGCDQKMIKGFAAQNGFVLNCIRSKRNLVEVNYIFSIEKMNTTPHL